MNQIPRDEITIMTHTDLAGTVALRHASDDYGMRLFKKSLISAGYMWIYPKDRDTNDPASTTMEPVIHLGIQMVHPSVIPVPDSYYCTDTSLDSPTRNPIITEIHVNPKLGELGLKMVNISDTDTIAGMRIPDEIREAIAAVKETHGVFHEAYREYTTNVCSLLTDGVITPHILLDTYDMPLDPLVKLFLHQMLSLRRGLLAKMVYSTDTKYMDIYLRHKYASLPEDTKTKYIYIDTEDGDTVVFSFHKGGKVKVHIVHRNQDGAIYKVSFDGGYKAVSSKHHDKTIDAYFDNTLTKQYTHSDHDTIQRLLYHYRKQEAKFDLGTLYIECTADTGLVLFDTTSPWVLRQICIMCAGKDISDIDLGYVRGFKAGMFRPNSSTTGSLIKVSRIFPEPLTYADWGPMVVQLEKQQEDKKNA